jgi:predicted nucleic acid-binding protein
MLQAHLGQAAVARPAQAEGPHAFRERGGRPLNGFDGLIAAIASSRDAVIATRNVPDFADCGVPIVNPWDNLGPSGS